MGFLWLIIAALMYISIMGIPLGKVCMKISLYIFYPFNSDVLNRHNFIDAKESSENCSRIICNQIWFVTFGWILLLGHLIFSVFQFLTLHGTSFARIHFDLACISLSPSEANIVCKEDARLIKRRDALKRVQILKNEIVTHKK